MPSHGHGPLHSFAISAHAASPEPFPQRSRPLQPAPHHARSRPRRAETPQGGQRPAHRRRRPRLAAGPVPGRRRRRPHRPGRFRRGRFQQPPAPGAARHRRRRPAQAALGPRPARRPSTPRCGSTCTRRASTSANALELFEPYDIIIDGTDNFPTRYLVNDACVLLKKPNVYGSIFRFDGQASVFYPGRRARATAASIPSRRRRARCRAAPRAACWASCRA